MPVLDQLNAVQKKAVTWGRDPLLLLAGPGSGKTFTIVNRILYLLEQGVNPVSILVITFTREAAQSMEQRFKDMSGSNSPVCFGTFHSVYYHILKESPDYSHYQIIPESQKQKMMLEVIRQTDSFEVSRIGDDYLYEEALQLLSAISFYKNTLDYKKALQKVSAKWQKHFSIIMTCLHDKMKRAGMMDFDDILFECKKILDSNPVIRDYWKQRFSYIIVDEFQDINPVQYEILKRLMRQETSIMAVGDDDQSIYGFRGSMPNLLQEFEKDFHAKRLLLNINYRSTKNIINASLAVIQENKKRYFKELVSGKKDVEEAPVRAHDFTNREQEYEYLLQQLILSQKDEKKEALQCAILFRTNSYMQCFAVRLKNAGVPFLIKEKVTSIYEHFIAQDILAYMMLANGSWEREYLLRVMNRPFRSIQREALYQSKDIADIRLWYQRYEEDIKKKNRIIRIMQQFEKDLRNLKALSPGIAVSYILNAVHYRDYLTRKAGSSPGKMDEWMELVDWLRKDAGQYASVKEWHQAQIEYTENLNKRRRDTLSFEKIKNKDTAVRLMTVHAAKGLEFDKVFIPDCNERIFPHGRMPDQETVEEERRLFYVGMTRAKKDLELLYLTGDQTRPRLPSRFMNPLLIPRQ